MKELKKILVTDIDWDAPDEVGLPNEMILEDPTGELSKDVDGYSDEIADALSDESGWLVKNFHAEVFEEKEEL